MNAITARPFSDERRVVLVSSRTRTRTRMHTLARMLARFCLHVSLFALLVLLDSCCPCRCRRCVLSRPVLRLTVVRKWIAGGPVVREEQRRHSGRPDYWMRQRRVRRQLIIIWLSVTRLSHVAALPRCSFAALQRCSQIIGNTRVTLEYARVTLDGVTALDLLWLATVGVFRLPQLSCGGAGGACQPQSAPLAVVRSPEARLP